jgi:hypothetical protein
VTKRETRRGQMPTSMEVKSLKAEIEGLRELIRKYAVLAASYGDDRMLWSAFNEGLISEGQDSGWLSHHQHPDTWKGNLTSHEIDHPALETRELDEVKLENERLKAQIGRRLLPKKIYAHKEEEAHGLTPHAVSSYMRSSPCESRHLSDLGRLEKATAER